MRQWTGDHILMRSLMCSKQHGVTPCMPSYIFRRMCPLMCNKANKMGVDHAASAQMCVFSCKSNSKDAEELWIETELP